MKRKIAAILAADVAGYSRLVAEDEEAALRRLAAYRGIFEEFIANHGGRIFNTAGDAVLAEFASSVEAVRCAVEVQESLRTRNLPFPPERQMLFRVGITIADVVERDGDLLGDGVNIAARLEGIADPGGICVSRAVYEQVANKISVAFTDIGHQSVKNIPEPVHAFVIPGGPGLVVSGKRREVVARQSRGYRLPTLLLAVFSAVAASGALAWVILKPIPSPGPSAPTTIGPVARPGTPAAAPPSTPKEMKDANGSGAPPATPHEHAADAPTGAPVASSAHPASGAGLKVDAPPASKSPPGAPEPKTASPEVASPSKDGAPASLAGAPFTWDPLIERPFDIRALPIVPLDVHASLRAALSAASGRKALAVSGNGTFAVGSSPDSADQAVRQALDTCARRGGICRVVAVDDKYVVPLPRTAFVRGLFDPLKADQVAPAERVELARRLGAASGWSAVAVGSTGRAGVGSGAANEAEAIQRALADCASRDSNCRLMAIGPFRVERF
jgi:adenylate cyclase